MTRVADTDIRAAIAGYIVSQQPSAFTAETLPCDRSLIDLGLLDSVGVIEFIVFVQATWGIEIAPEDITKERMGSVQMMASLVKEYLARK
jgi:acyl carrier protein